ncbi:MAG: MBOAT family protein [Planctomycetota bacterium]
MPTGEIPAWAVMWGLAVVIFYGCKTLTWVAADGATAALSRSAAYFVAWPGLDTRAFLRDDGPRPARPTLAEWVGAAVTTAAGGVLVFAVSRRVTDDYLAGWVGMVGLIMLLHFGSFHLLSCAWRRAGVDAKPLMNKPFASTGLGEFWGRRWNTAFRDLAHRFLFRPLTPRLGPRGAVFAGFLFSGVVHDVVISWPAGGGWGGPTSYFVLQACGMLAERSRAGRGLGLGRGVVGWLFAMTLLGLPLGLLFHRPFVLEVIVPFLDAIGARG